MNYEVKNAVRILKERGLLGILGRLVAYLRYPATISAFKRGMDVGNLDELVEFAFTGCSGILKPYQVREEIKGFLSLIQQECPRRVLEIGTAMGGTLLMFCRVASETATIVSLDLPAGQFGNGYPIWRIPIYRRFVTAGQKLHLVRADSHESSTLEKVKQLLGDKKVDLLFIDGDHTYGGVRKDFEMFGPLVRPDGIIAFHDIAPHGHDEDCGVDRFWSEVKEQYEAEEFVEDWEQQWAGIGVLRWKG